MAPAFHGFDGASPRSIAEELATSEVQVIAMLRRGDIRAFQIGGRRQWCVDPPNSRRTSSGRMRRRSASWRSAGGAVTKRPLVPRCGIGVRGQPVR
jgi:hypothetical protein